MGERWSFMILRASFNGLHHFEEFLSELGIARNILSNRLAKLVEHGILKREPCADDRRKIEYRLTTKGFDLLPAMIALRQWGQKYGAEIEENPVLVDEVDRLPIGPVSILSHDGRILDHRDLWLVRPQNVGERADGSIAKPGKGMERGDVVDAQPAKRAAVATAGRNLIIICVPLGRVCGRAARRAQASIRKPTHENRCRDRSMRTMSYEMFTMSEP